MWLATGLLVFALVAGGATWLISSSPRPAPADLPSATAAERWTLLDLATRIEAGEVKAPVN